MNTEPYYFDIETGALPEEEIAHLMPQFAAPANYKDPEKIKAYIEGQRIRWLQEAALSPLTGCVLCVGVLGPDGMQIIESESEDQILAQFWEFIRIQFYAQQSVYGWCIHHFDLPFLVKRSWHHSIPIPSSLRDGESKQYWNSLLVDLQARWQMGDRQCESSLDTASKFIGLPGKNGNGADFAKLWESDRPAAVSYLKNDLELTRDIHQRMTKVA